MGRGVGIEQQEQTLDGARAQKRQPGGGRLARGRAVGAQIGDEHLDLSGGRRLDRHEVLRAWTRG